MNKVCIITGTRADYGLLKPLIKKIDDDKELHLQIISTGMHLSPEFGMTYREIKDDGFTIDEKIEIILSSDTPIGIAKSMGLALISFSESYVRLSPDLIIVLGDRYEIFAAVSAASIARIPVAHLHGGETTEGAVDEAFRHAITKMSYLHFTSTEEYRRRVIQLGENPSRVYNVGAIGIESIKILELMPKNQLQKDLGFEFGQYTALVTFHPVTLEDNTSEVQFSNLLTAIDQIKNLKVIFTKANSDTSGRIINFMIDEYVNKNRHKSIAFTSMGQLRYLSSMKYVDLLIGNSSSGILETPTFRKPTINIGDRQKGRIQAKSVINCNPTTDEIMSSIHLALSPEFKKGLINIKSPYGEGQTTNQIVSTIKEYLLKPKKIQKKFYDL